MTQYAHIVGWSMCVPQKIVTNDDLAQRIDTSDEWIRSRTGILQRHIADNKESTASLAIKATQRAMDFARISPNEIDLVIVTTLTPEYASMPATACLVQDGIGAKRAGAFDLSAGCTGFVYGMAVADAMIRSGCAKTIVVVGAETMSRILDWEDRSTCVLFGDGAGAVILQARDEPGGILSHVLHSDGGGANYLIIPAGGSKLPTSVRTVSEHEHFVRMNGSEVFRFATRIMSQVIQETCEKAGISLDQVNLIIPHQANSRIIQSAGRYLKLGNDRMYENLQRYGNTSCASIPIALCEAINEGKIKTGDYVVFVGFGAGLTWGAVALQWGTASPAQTSAGYQQARTARYHWAQFTSRVKWFFLNVERRLTRGDHDDKS